MIASVLLSLAFLLGLLLIPFGLPGLWLMAAAAAVHRLAVPEGGLGWWTVGGLALAAALSEVLDFVLSARATRKHGGSRRAVWGAILGGLAGALAGLPVPVAGPILGAFLGSFAGAWLGEASRGSSLDASTRAATGALIGRVLSAALKVAIGVALAAWVAFDLWG